MQWMNPVVISVVVYFFRLTNLNKNSTLNSFFMYKIPAEQNGVLFSLKDSTSGRKQKVLIVFHRSCTFVVIHKNLAELGQWAINHRDKYGTLTLEFPELKYVLPRISAWRKPARAKVHPLHLQQALTTPQHHPAHPPHSSCNLAPMRKSRCPYRRQIPWCEHKQHIAACQ